jgi:hypothetical protein
VAVHSSPWPVLLLTTTPKGHLGFQSGWERVRIEVTVGVKRPIPNQFRIQKVERETGPSAPSTKQSVEFTYRLA